jgi:hypothetical protein
LVDAFDSPFVKEFVFGAREIGRLTLYRPGIGPCRPIMPSQLWMLTSDQFFRSRQDQ